jgi:transcriptional regulator with XRE-family HTH domain
VDDLAVGRVFRELRIRLQWRQQDVARRAGISDSTYSRIERGELGRTTLDVIRRVAAVLEVRLSIEPRWRGAALDRLVSRRHAAMTEIVAQILTRAGWEVRPEVSFSEWGERGVVDLVAWSAAHRAALLVELKTELVDVNDLLAVCDRRRRLAGAILKPLGWDPLLVGQWVVLAASRTNARRVAEHRTAIRAAFPSDGRSVAGWLSRPTGPASALWYLPDSRDTSLRRRITPTMRVRPRTPNVETRSEAA